MSPDTLNRATHRPVTFPRVGRIVRDTEQGVAPDLPQSTVSAVRTALSNRQVQIHELQVSGRQQIICYACEGRRRTEVGSNRFTVKHLMTREFMVVDGARGTFTGKCFV